MAQTLNDSDNVSTVLNYRSFATQPPSTRGRHTEYEGLTHVVSLSQGGHEFSDLRDVIVLDSGSSILNGSFCNADLLGNIRVSKDPINMITNKGEGAMNLEGDSLGFGSVYHDPGGIANVVSLR